MLVVTLLNRCYKFKSFVYQAVHLEEEPEQEPKIIVEIVPRRNGKRLCPKCLKPCVGYGQLPTARDFRFIDIWGMSVFFRYRRRRVLCRKHGVLAEWLPWAEDKSPLTIPFRLHLAHWAKYLSWQTVAELFNATWSNVYASVAYVVDYGLKRRCLEGIRAVGIDEIKYRVGNNFLTLVYQLDQGCRRLLYVGKDRTEESLRGFFQMLGEARCLQLEAICTDMWRPYLNVISEMAKNAINILDRFHIMKQFNEAIDDIRRKEQHRLEKDGYEPILRNSRWLLLKNPLKQTTRQLIRLADLLAYNLKTVRAYLLKEDFQQFWEYNSPYWAGWFLKQWTKRAMYSKIDEIKEVARMLRRHQHLILNWFETKERISNGISEGFNLKAKLTMRKAYGFKQYETIQIALYHQLGELPMPELTHKFF